MTNFHRFYRASMMVTVLTASCGFMLGAVRADASTFIVPELDELVAMSSAVVQGAVISREYRVDDRGRIVTDYRVAATATVAGQLDADAGSTVTFTFPGGTIDDETELVTGVPVFSPGDEVVLFVKKASGAATGFYLVTGLAVGALKIERDADGAARVRGLAAQAFNKNQARKAGIDARPIRDTAPLPDFLDMVRNAALTKGVTR